ncbi:hypothetical protein [Streptomyces longwoodensis]|uniref:hypothetical protein n=1 Tax=Streptomyces longwoodensis TaxID=68231 RepID=UPI0033FB5232
MAGRSGLAAAAARSGTREHFTLNDQNIMMRCTRASAGLRPRGAGAARRAVEALHQQVPAALGVLDQR